MSTSELRVWSEPEVDRARRYDRVLLDLSMCGAVTHGDLDQALRAICADAAAALEVDRASVWLFDETHTRLQSAVIYSARAGTWLEPAEIRAEDNPPYFAAVAQERVLAVDDPCNDPRTRRFANAYLRPLDITAMIDAPIRLSGRMLGVICLEQVGSERHWTTEERRFAASLGDLLALAIAAQERACAERALRDSELRHRLLVDGVCDVIFQIDRGGRILSLNPAFETLLGRRIADWVGRAFPGLIFVDDMETALDLFGRAVAGETPPTFEIRLTDAQGAPVWFEFRISLLHDGNSVGSVFGVGREVTARRETAEVSTSLARIGEELIASVDMPILLDRLCRLTAEELGCDVSHTFLRDEEGVFNQVAAYGHSPAAADADALRTLPIPPDHLRGLLDAFERDWVVVARPGDGLVADFLWEAYETSGAILIALRRGTQLIGAQTGAVRDPGRSFGSRQVRIAHGIARLASLALANARLVSELETVSRLKSDFVAMMSHELRTPLNVILGYNEILLDELADLDADQSEALQSMRASALQLLALVEATLDLSRLETGRAPLQLGDLDLVAWLHAVRDETAGLRQEKPHLSFEWVAPTGGSVAHTDAMKLTIIAKNLISNAVKFTAEGSVRVALGTTPSTVELAVRDTGIGMSTESLAFAFEPFRQGDSSMTRRYGGIGLGLYVVSRLLDVLGGTIQVESAPGRGSLFRIEIPRDGRAARPRSSRGVRVRALSPQA